jgi:hypothetical protein
MTIAELEMKFARLEAELNILRHELLRLKGVDVIPGIGPIGTFKDDPTFPEAVRLGREYREQVNRESLEEMDREEAAAKLKKKRKPRKPDARA